MNSRRDAHAQPGAQVVKIDVRHSLQECDRKGAGGTREHRSYYCVRVYIGATQNRSLSNTEVPIRRFTVGFLAFAALAAAGYLLTRRRPTLSAVRNTNRKPVEDLYAAGL